MSEHEIIKNIISKYSYVNDDVYIDKDGFMYKIDGFQLGYTFDFMDYYDLGWKAVTAAISDVFSRGGEPKNILASIGIEKGKISKIEEIVKGIKDACDYYHTSFVGGDLNSSTGSGWIDISVTGKTLCNTQAENVKEGDSVIITNPIGYTSLVFISYLNSWKIELSYIEKNKIKHPIINRRIASLFKNYCTSIHYSTDISDGVIISLYNIMERSHKGIKLYRMPFSDYVSNKLTEYHIKIDEVLKYSGEEFETLLVIDKKYTEEILTFMEYLGFSPIYIGEISNTNNLQFNDKIIKKTGWDNFTGWF